MSDIFVCVPREVIEKKPEDFKIPCLRNIRKLFPSENEPFYAGFGNRTNVRSFAKRHKWKRNRIDHNEFWHNAQSFTEILYLL